MASHEYEEEDYYYDENDDMITAEDCWTVISSFFDAKGLVSQQLDSYDEFTRNTIQDVVRENGHVILDQYCSLDPEENDPVIKRRYEIRFGRVYLARPSHTEGDGTTQQLTPHEARLRNLTYSGAMMAEMESRIMVARRAHRGSRLGRGGQRARDQADGRFRLAVAAGRLRRRRAAGDPGLHRQIACHAPVRFAATVFNRVAYHASGPKCAICGARATKCFTVKTSAPTIRAATSSSMAAKRS